MISLPKEFLENSVDIVDHDGDWIQNGDAKILSFNEYWVQIEDKLDVRVIPWTAIRCIKVRKPKP